MVNFYTSSSPSSGVPSSQSPLTIPQLHGPFPVASRPGHPQVPCKSKRELPPPNSPGLHFLRHRSHRVSPLASGPHLPGDPVVPQQAERCAPAGSGHGYHWRQQCGPLWAVPEFRTRERGRPVARVTCSKERDAWSPPYLPLVRSPIRERTQQPSAHKRETRLLSTHSKAHVRPGGAGSSVGSGLTRPGSNLSSVTRCGRGLSFLMCERSVWGGGGGMADRTCPPQARVPASAQ